MQIMKQSSELREYFIHCLDILLCGVSRILEKPVCSKQDLVFQRIALFEFQSNIEADHRFNSVIKHRVASLDLRYNEIEEKTFSEKIFEFFSSEESRLEAKECKAAKAILREFQEQLYSLKLFSAHYDLSCSMDKLTAKYLTVAPM